jgi:hypothetical protein
LIVGQIVVRLRKPKTNGDSLVPAELLAAAQSPHPGTAHAPHGVPSPQPAAE